VKEVKILLVLVILSIAQSKDRQLSLLEYNSLDNKEYCGSLSPKQHLNFPSPQWPACA
jgi:hypothetical protein